MAFEPVMPKAVEEDVEMPGPAFLIGGVTPQDEQKPGRGIRQNTAHAQVGEPVEVGAIIEDVLDRDAFAPHPAEEGGRLLLAGAEDLAQPDRDAGRAQVAHQIHLLGRRIAPDRFRRHLDGHGAISARADRSDGFPVEGRVEHVALRGVAHVHVDGRGARRQALRGRLGEFGDGHRQSRVIGLRAAGTVRRRHDQQGVQSCLRANLSLPREAVPCFIPHDEGRTRTQ